MAYPVNGAGGQQVVEFRARAQPGAAAGAQRRRRSPRPARPRRAPWRRVLAQPARQRRAVASQPHPERKIGADRGQRPVPRRHAGHRHAAAAQPTARATAWTRATRVITAVRGTPRPLVIETQNHFYDRQHRRAAAGHAARRAGAQRAAGPCPTRAACSSACTTRWRRCPMQPMPPRRADARVGLLQHQTVLDFSDDLARTPRQRYVNRWRLREEGPGGGAVRAGQADHLLDRPQRAAEVPRRGHAPASSSGTRPSRRSASRTRSSSGSSPTTPTSTRSTSADASVRWMTNADARASAPSARSHVDPRTGEILDADIGIESLSLAQPARVARADHSATRLEPALDLPDAGVSRGPRRLLRTLCSFADMAAEQLGYALDVLEARGEIDPDSPEAEQFVLDYVKDTTMHEVGHTLGLRHNFRASRVYTEAAAVRPGVHARQRHHRLGDGVQRRSTCRGRAQPGGAPFQTTLGPYDYWAIEYAYKPLARAGRRRRAAAHRRAQHRAAAGLRHRRGQPPRHRPGDAAVRPRRRRRSPSPPSAWRSRATCSSARRRASSSPTRTTPCCAARWPMRLRDVGRAVGVLARQIGGVRTLRDFPGSGRDPLQPVPAAHAAPGARADRAARAVRRRAGGDRRRCSAGWRPTSDERSDASPRLADRLLGAAASARPAARGAEPADERRRGGTHPRQRRQGRPAAARHSACPSCMRG